MNPIRLSICQSFRFKALLVATASLALIIAVFFAISNQWLRRERLAAEQQRSQILLKHLASNLRFGMTVQSADLIRPVLEHALITQEVRAVAVYDRNGTQVAVVPSTTEYAGAFPAVGRS